MGGLNTGQYMQFISRLLVFSTIVFPLFVGIASAQSNDGNSTITLVYANKWAPISGGEGDQVEGILPSLMEEIIHNRMGIRVIHKGLPWGRAQEVIKRGDADGFITTPTEARQGYSVASKQTVLQLPFQAFVKKGSASELDLKAGKPLTELGTTRFCDVLGNGWAKAFYDARNITYLEVPSLDNCLKMLNIGRTDIVIHASPVTQLFIRKLAIAPNIGRIAHVYPESPEFPLLLSKKSTYGAGFLARFDKIVADMKQSQEYEKILDQLTQENIDQF